MFVCVVLRYAGVGLGWAELCADAVFAVVFGYIITAALLFLFISFPTLSSTSLFVVVYLGMKTIIAKPVILRWQQRKRLNIVLRDAVECGSK